LQVGQVGTTLTFDFVKVFDVFLAALDCAALFVDLQLVAAGTARKFGSFIAARIVSDGTAIPDGYRWFGRSSRRSFGDAIKRRRSSDVLLAPHPPAAPIWRVPSNAPCATVLSS